MLKRTLLLTILVFSIIVSVYGEIGYQEGYPVIFNDYKTLNPIVTEDLNPNYEGKELLFFAGGTYPGGGTTARLMCYSSDGELIFENILWNGLNSYSYKPVIADIDCNGSKEIILSYRAEQDYSEISILNFDGSVFSTNWPITINNPSGITNVSVGDINNDGDLEIVTIINKNEIIVYNHDSSIVWSYSLSQEWGMIWSSPVISDLDFDNNKEIIVLVSELWGGSKLYVLDSQGVLLPGWPITFDIMMPWMSPVVGDFNHSNNSLELVVADDHYSTIVHCFNIDGSYVDGWPVEIPHSGGREISENDLYYIDDDGNDVLTNRDRWNGSSPLTVVDFQNDDDLEIIIVGDNEMHILNSDGSFYQPFSELILDGPIYSPAVGDVDSDGNIDIVFMSFENFTQKLYGYDNCGNLLNDFPIIVKEFQENTTMVRSRTNPPTFDDIDNDGDLEIIVSAWLDIYDQAETGRVSVYDVLSEYNIQNIEWRTSLKNNWNNGIYCQYFGNLNINNSEQHQLIDRVCMYSDVIVSNNSTLIVNDNTLVHILNDSQLTIEENASLNIGRNIVFEGDSINDYGIIALNSIGTTNFNETHFQYCNLNSTNGNLTISNSNFIGCNLHSQDGFLHIVDSEFDGENSGYSSGIWCYNNSEVVFDNIIVENYHQGIRLNYQDVFNVSNSISRNNDTQCFSVFNSRNRHNTIYNSQFYGSSAVGLLSYGSSVKVTSCNISQNGRGVFLMNRSNVTIEKKPETHSWYLDSVIANNSWEEILFYDDCRLHLADNRNKIMDNNYTPGTSDEFLINCPNLMRERDFSYNFWGYTDMYNNAILPPDNRFFPEGAYHLSPVYDPGIPREDGKPDDQILYETAVIEAENGNTVQAEIMLKDLIAQYPESDYKRSSASYLLSIQEEDFQALKAYFNDEPNLHSDDLIELYTAYLQTYCDIQSENYQEAIDWLESIITNPPSLVDSVYAVIDLGDIYLQMEGNGRGAVGIYPNFIPRSKEDFEETIEDLFALLSEEYHYENEPEEEPSNYSLPTCATLNANYPNPFNPETTILFSIPIDSKVNLSVYNIKGQKIRNLVNNKIDKGNHSVVWYGDDELGNSVSSGVYFYKLNVNGESKQIRKCILMK